MAVDEAVAPESVYIQPTDAERALDVAKQILQAAGPDVGLLSFAVTGTGIVHVKPWRLENGAAVAAAVGIADRSPVLHLHTHPAQQEFSGEVDGIEVHVHATYHPAAA